MKFGTKAIHSGQEPEPVTGAIMTPIFQTSTYVQAGPGENKGYEYARTNNPTRTALQKNLAALENGKFALCFSSGMATVDAIIKLFQPGDEILSTNDLYGGVYRIFTKVFEKYGITFRFMDMQNPKAVEKNITKKTKLIWIETPTNPLLRIADIEALTSLAKKNKILTAVDNTFASPFLQNPLDLGADMVVHSITKYIGGHSDLVMGCVILNDEKMHEDLKFIQNACGAVPSPMDCFLTLRGIKTLHVRIQRHCENAKAVAEFLKTHPKADEVYWPGFSDSTNHKIAKKQMRDFGGMVSFTLKGDKMNDTLRVIKSTKIFSLAESLGGVESLIGHPATMTHASIPKKEREAAGLKDTLIRLSVGIEDADDLIGDLKNALTF